MRKLLIVLGSVLALTATACGGDGGGVAEGPGVTSATGATRGTGPTATTGGTGARCVDLTGEGVAFTVRLEKNEFVPNCFTASASQGITIVNADAVLHNFTIQGTSISVDIPPGDEFNGDPITGVVDPGLYVLVCLYHVPGMMGEITVVA